MRTSKGLSFLLVLLLLVGCTHLRPGKRDFGMWAVHFDTRSGFTAAAVRISDSDYLLRYGEDETTATLRLGTDVLVSGSTGVDKKATVSIWRSFLGFMAGLFSGLLAKGVLS